MVIKFRRERKRHRTQDHCGDQAMVVHKKNQEDHGDGERERFTSWVICMPASTG